MHVSDSRITTKLSDAELHDAITHAGREITKLSGRLHDARALVCAATTYHEIASVDDFLAGAARHRLALEVYEPLQSQHAEWSEQKRRAYQIIEARRGPKKKKPKGAKAAAVEHE